PCSKHWRWSTVLCSTHGRWPSIHMGRCSLWQNMSSRRTHNISQLRVGGQIDRWRKFPLGGIVPVLSHEEYSSKVSRCQCSSSQTTTQSVL
ncbi:hypothetical protein PC118_g25873, partial [Phytophthora cactorum]